MTIGKRKGSAAKGVGGTGTNNVNKVGGSLSKNDHWYIQQAFGMSSDPGAAIPAQTTSGGIVSEYTDPGPGNVYRAHVFTGSGTFVVTDPTITAVEWLIVGGGGAVTSSGIGQGYNGNDSSFGGTTSLGGGGGGTASPAGPGHGLDGGSGGGGSA